MYTTRDTLSYLKDTDYIILSQLDDESLYETCYINKNMYHFCMNNQILKQRIVNYEYFLLDQMFDAARHYHYQDYVYVHILYDYKPINSINYGFRKQIKTILPKIQNVNFYKNDMSYTIKGDDKDIVFSIKTIVEALGYNFDIRKIHLRNEYGEIYGEIEYDL